VALLVLVFVFSLLFADVVRHVRIGVSMISPVRLIYSIEDPAALQGQLDQFLAMQSFGRVEQATQITRAVYPWIVLAAFIWIVISYRMGDAIILKFTKARRVIPGALGDNQELFRLVENTAIMGGLPTPEVYIIDDNAMNAFAAGRDPSTASIALTKGLIEKLNKAELQAVIAHELAHIGNRDTRLMQITIEGIGFFIICGELLMSQRRGHFSLVAFIIGSLFYVFGHFVAPILRFALSRSREYQADATAVKITRDADSLAQALSKISLNPHTDALSGCPLIGNMCIVAPAKAGLLGFIGNLYATHPPVEDRITALRKMTGKQAGQTGQNGSRVTGRVIDFP